MAGKRQQHRSCHYHHHHQQQQQQDKLWGKSCTGAQFQKPFEGCLLGVRTNCITIIIINIIIMTIIIIIIINYVVLTCWLAAAAAMSIVTPSLRYAVRQNPQLLQSQLKSGSETCLARRD